MLLDPTITTGTLNLLKSVASASTLLARLAGRPRISSSAGLGHGVNSDGIGTYLAAAITIWNPGNRPIYFGGFGARAGGGDEYYPMSDLAPGTKLDPGQYFNACIPVGHFLGPDALELWVIDGSGRRHRIQQSQLRRLLADLRTERSRLRSPGLAC